MENPDKIATLDT